MAEKVPPTKSELGAGERLLSDKFEVLSEISSGGMGKVLRVRQIGFDRIFAAKVIRPDASHQESFKRLVREGQILTKLQHRNIVKVYAATVDEQQGLVIVMEYLDGKSLSSMIQEGGRLDIQVAFELAKQISDALANAHGCGIFHRDLKPGNVMVLANEDAPPRAVLIDFGIAKLQDGNQQLTRTGTVLGTPLYMSPEQFQGKVLDGRSDIYSWGCLVYEMLAGVPPFSADNPLEIAARHCTEPPPPPSGINHNVPPELEAAVMKCLEKDPEKRYQSAAELRDDLAEMVLSAPRPQKAVRLSAFKPLKGSRAQIMVGAIALGFMGCIAWFMPRDKGPPPPEQSINQSEAVIRKAKAELYSGQYEQARTRLYDFLRPLKVRSKEGDGDVQKPQAPLPPGYTPLTVIQGVDLLSLAKMTEVDRLADTMRRRRQSLADAKDGANVVSTWLDFFGPRLHLPPTALRSWDLSVLLTRVEAANKEKRTHESEPELRDVEAMMKQAPMGDAQAQLLKMRYCEAKAESLANLGQTQEAAKFAEQARRDLEANFPTSDQELQEQHEFWCDFVRKNLKYATPDPQSSSNDTD